MDSQFLSSTSRDHADLASTTNNGFALQTAWFGEPTVRPASTAKAKVHMVTRTACTALVRAHLRANDRPIPMRELHEVTGCVYEEISAALAKMRQAGQVNVSKTVVSVDGQPVPRDEWVKTYRWVGPAGSGDLARRRRSPAGTASPSSASGSVAGSGTDVLESTNPRH